jgi:diamine N-acetyltransferase
MSFILGSLSLRPLEKSDLQWLQAHRNDQSTWMNLTDIRMVSMDQEEQWFSGIQRDPARMCLVIEDCSRLVPKSIGIIKLSQIDWINRSLSIAADIAPDSRGSGYGKALWPLILKYCFQFLNMNRVWFLVADWNSVGKHIYTKVGFKTEGVMRQALYRDGQYHDYILMGMLRSEYDQIFV